MQRKPRTSNGSVNLAALLAIAALIIVPGVTQAERQAIRGSHDWVISSHPCPGGNRTDALQMDDDGTLWVGCGTAAAGYGLFVSHDGGINWAAASTTPPTIFDPYRVSSISRGHDGALYVAGTSTAHGSQMVMRVDTDVSPSPVTVVLEGVQQLGRLFHVGNYRELPTGEAIADDLNGYFMLYRPTATTGTSAANWTQIDTPNQILDMTLIQSRDHIIAGGSTIIEPPRVFLPPTNPADAPWQFDSFVLPTATGWEGEIWGVAASNNRVYAVGEDQDNNIGRIFVSGSNPYDPGSYQELSMTDIVNPGSGIHTWARGVCAHNNTVVVVGERQPLSSGTGLVLLSTNAGQSFVDVTPTGVTASVSKCALLDESGPIVVAGAAGFIGILPGDIIFKDGFDSQG